MKRKIYEISTVVLLAGSATLGQALFAQDALVVPLFDTKNVSPAHTTTQLPYDKNYVMLPLTSGTVQTSENGEMVVVSRPIRLSTRHETVIPMKEIMGQVKPMPVAPRELSGAGYVVHSVNSCTRCNQGCPQTTGVIYSGTVTSQTSQPTLAPTPAQAVPANEANPYAPPSFTLAPTQSAVGSEAVGTTSSGQSILSTGPLDSTHSVLTPSESGSSVVTTPGTITTPDAVPATVPATVPPTTGGTTTSEIQAVPRPEPVPTRVDSMDSPMMPSTAPIQTPSESIDPYQTPSQPVPSQQTPIQSVPNQSVPSQPESYQTTPYPQSGSVGQAPYATGPSGDGATPMYASKPATQDGVPKASPSQSGTTRQYSSSADYYGETEPYTIPSSGSLGSASQTRALEAPSSTAPNGAQRVPQTRSQTQPQVQPQTQPQSQPQTPAGRQPVPNALPADQPTAPVEVPTSGRNV